MKLRIKWKGLSREKDKQRPRKRERKSETKSTVILLMPFEETKGLHFKIKLIEQF